MAPANMTRLIVSIVFFIILAVFTAMNVGFTTSINLFGYKIAEVSVVAVSISAMAVGILYSFALYLSNFLARSKATKVKRARVDAKAKEKELAAKEQTIREALGDEGRTTKEPSSEVNDAVIGEAAAGNAVPTPGKKKRRLPGLRRKSGGGA